MIDRTGRPWQGLMLATAGIGGLVLAIANQQTRLWWMFSLFILGMGLVSLALLSLHESIQRRVGDREPGSFSWPFGALLGGGIVLVVGAVATGWLSIVPIVGVIMVVLGSSGLSVWVKHRLRNGAGSAGPAGDDAPALDEPVAATKAYEQRTEGVMEVVATRFERIGVGSLAWVGFEGMAIGVGLLMIEDSATSLVGLVVWLVGLVVVKFGVQPYLGSQGERLPRIGRILIDASIAGLFVLFIGAFGGSLLLVLVGGSVLIAAVSLLGIAAQEIVNVAGSPAMRPRAVQMIATATLVAVANLIYVAWVTSNNGLALVLMVLAVGAGMWFVFRGEWIMIALLVGYVLSWGLVDRADPLAEALPPSVAEQPVTMVAIGDSFISGEGAKRFFDGTNDVGGNQCRRSPSSHPFLVASALELNLVSTACSGAKIADVTTCGQMWPAGRRCRNAGWESLPDDVPLESSGALPQLVDLDRRLVSGGVDRRTDVEVVVVSIGGNDVGFSAIVKACLLPKGCDERREFWLNRVTGLRPQLIELYADLKTRFPEAEVIVMPYPMLVDADRSCDLGLSKSESEFVVDFIDQLDQVMSAASAAAEVTYLADAKHVFEQAKLCDNPSAANHLRVVPPAGSRLGRYSPATWIPGSMHPNELGHERTAGVLCAKVAEVTERALPDRCQELLDAIPEPADADTLEDVNRFAPVGAAEALSERCEPEVVGEGAPPPGAPTTSGTPPSVPPSSVPPSSVPPSSVPEGIEAELEAASEERCAVEEAVDVLADQVTAVTDELLSDDEWIRDELFRTIRALALPLALFLASGVVLAAGLVRFDHALVNFLCGRRRIGSPD